MIDGQKILTFLTRAPLGSAELRAPLGGGADSAPPPEIYPNYWADFQNSNAIG